MAHRADADPLAARREALETLAREVTACRRCPRLRAYCAEVARTKVRRFRDEPYWGRPVPGFGDPGAALLVIGLAPAAHGGNRTGRMFTGDESGDWLYEALHRAGFASQPASRHRGDGLVLRGAYVTASARCAPPGNKPLAEELDSCRPYLLRELAVLRDVRVVLCLGRIAFDTYRGVLRARGVAAGGLAFAHGAVFRFPDPALPVLVASYHPSRQNTRTGRLTRDMWHAVFDTVRSLVDAAAAAAPGPDGGGPWDLPPPAPR